MKIEPCIGVCTPNFNPHPGAVSWSDHCRAAGRLPVTDGIGAIYIEPNDANNVILASLTTGLYR
jgi:hypothetical protein